MANRYVESREASEQLQSQKQMLQLLTALLRNSYDPERVLELVQMSGIHRAALLLHQEGASVWGETSNVQKWARHFQAAIDCCLGDADCRYRRLTR